MAAPRLRPDEPWPSVPCGELPDSVDRRAIRMAATQALWGLSGRRFGFSTLTLYPCTRRCSLSTTARFLAASSPIDFPWWGGWWTGPWPACGCRRDCSCKTLPTVKLPGPMADLYEVTIDGASLAVSGVDAAVRIDNWRQLVRTDGGKFPTCQDEDNPFSVRYRRGRPIPELGQIAMGELEMELAMACTGGPCALGSRVRETTRKGVREVALDPQQMLKDGLTGLKRVDLFLTWANPHRLQRSSSVVNPEAVRHRRRGT